MTTTLTRRALGAAVLAGALLCVACNPLTPTIPPPAPAGGHAPVVVGDSRVWAVVITGGFVGTGYEDVTYMGWQMSTPQVQDTIRARRDAGTLDELVVALGTNDANPTWNGGWTDSDRNLWASTLLNLHPSTRLVIVLPWVDPVAQPAHAAQVERARADMRFIASLRPDHTVVVDSQSIPLGADGIHFAAPVAPEPGYATPEAIAATLDVIAGGLAAVR